MATEYPPLNRIHVVGYSANDQDYPILNLVADPRVAGYKVPEDFSVCPDKRYPNHIFTGAQPISGDQRVRHVWEILPSPWVPFTRYDDDLGPVQGRRRFVKNEGQKADLTSSTKTTYESREGSALVLNEIEETWDIKVDEDGNSLFPIRDRDFYDPLRGAVQERRQLFVPTGEEVATLENINGIITQTSYEPYNEFLSYKIVLTYAVDGPQLIGNQTNNEGQLVTVTTQRKGFDNYTPPEPTATRAVEVSREDAESLVERIIDAPNVFDEKIQTNRQGAQLPQKFISGQITSAQVIASTDGDPDALGTDGTGVIESSIQRVTEFKARKSKTEITSASSLTNFVFTTELGGGIAIVTETINPQQASAGYGTISLETDSIGGNTKLSRSVILANPPTLRGQEYDDVSDIPLQFTEQFQNAITLSELTDPESNAEVRPRDIYHSLVRKYEIDKIREEHKKKKWILDEVVNITLPDRLIGFTTKKIEIRGGEDSTANGNSSSATASAYADYEVDAEASIEYGYSGPVVAKKYIFFMEDNDEVLERLNEIFGLGVQNWPQMIPEPCTLKAIIRSQRNTGTVSVSLPNNKSKSFSNSETTRIESFSFPPTLHNTILLGSLGFGVAWTPDLVTFDVERKAEAIGSAVSSSATAKATASVEFYTNQGIGITETTPTQIPSGDFLYQVNSQLYKFGLVRVEAIVVTLP